LSGTPTGSDKAVAVKATVAILLALGVGLLALALFTEVERLPVLAGALAAFVIAVATLGRHVVRRRAERL